MLKCRSRSALVGWLAFLIGAAVCALAPAQAQTYRGAWDPLYGTPFTSTELLTFDLRWSGEAYIDVPVGCAPAGGNGNGTALCIGAALQVATVKLAKDGFPDGPPAPSYLSFYWDPPSMGPDVSDLLFGGGKITALRSLLSEWVYDSLTGWEFALLFARNGTSTPEEWTDPFLPGSPLPDDYNGPVLYSRLFNDGCNDLGCGFYEYGRNTATGDYRPQFREGGFALVPEPGASALVVVALFAAGFARRLRRRP